MDWLTDIGKVALFSAVSLLVLFLLTKLMGEKQISQLTMFDYVIGIAVGSIAAEMATELESPFYLGIVSMGVYALLSILVSVLSRRSVWLRRRLSGRILVLMDGGKIYRDNMKKARLDLDEFLSLARLAGFYDPTQIETAVFEPNGAISFLPRAECRPVTPGDLNLSPPPERPVTALILDGRILQSSLQSIGKDEKWLFTQLRQQGYHAAGEIFLGICDRKDALTLYPILEKKPCSHPPK